MLSIFSRKNINNFFIRSFI